MKQRMGACKNGKRKERDVNEGRKIKGLKESERKRGILQGRTREGRELTSLEKKRGWTERAVMDVERKKELTRKGIGCRG